MAKRQESGESKAPMSCQGTSLGEREAVVECPNLPCSLWVPAAWVHVGKVDQAGSLAVDETGASWLSQKLCS